MEENNQNSAIDPIPQSERKNLTESTALFSTGRMEPLAVYAGIPEKLIRYR